MIMNNMKRTTKELEEIKIFAFKYANENPEEVGDTWINYDNETDLNIWEDEDQIHVSAYGLTNGYIDMDKEIFIV